MFIGRFKKKNMNPFRMTTVISFYPVFKMGTINEDCYCYENQPSNYVKNA